MFNTRAISLFTGIALFLACSSASAVIIDFEEFNPPSGSLLNLGASGFTSNGFTFTTTSNGQLLIVDNAQLNLPNTGSNTFVAEPFCIGACGPAFFTLSHSSGAAFDLISLLALEGRNTNTGFFQFSALAIDLVGTFAAGGTISTTITLDLFAQENNLLDSQAIFFSGWTSLSSVSFTGVGGTNNGFSFALDDINVTTVFEPGTIALLSIGLLGVSLARRKRIS